MNYALFAVALISFLLYVKTIDAVLSNEYGSAVLNKSIVLCTTLFAFIHLWLLWRTPIHSHKFPNLAFICYIAGLIIFFSAKKATSTYRETLSFAPDSPYWLFSKGIYSVIRHPYFLAFCLTWVGGALDAHCLRTTVSATIMVYFYWSAAKQQERKYEQSILAVGYKHYKNRTGMFLPSFRLFR